MTGHTHEDIDQMFSCISRRLRKNNARTLLELIREIGMSYAPAIVASLITFMYDVKEWLEGCAISNLSGHIHQHQFKLVRGPDGKARLFYKKWSTTPTWSPPEGIALLQKTPSGKPNLVVPDVAKLNIPKLKQDIPRYSLHFDPPTTKWWEDFIKNGGPVQSENPQWVLPSLRRQPENNAEEISAVTSDIQDTLLKLVEREEREVEVIALICGENGIDCTVWLIVVHT